MKVLQINAVYKRLSTGVNVYEMNQTLSAHGHHCVAAFSDGKVEDPVTEYRIGSTFGQKLHALLSRITGMQGYFSSFSTKKLLRYMEKFQPDVVVLNNLHANYIHLPMLLKYLAQKDISTVVVLHDCWFYTGKCCYYATTCCNKWQSECGGCPVWDKYNKSWFFDRTKKMLRDKKEGFNAIPRLGVVAVSDWLLNEAKQSPVFANAQYFERIYNWIDTEKFAPVSTDDLRQRLKLTDKKVLLAVAAIWEPRKGLDTLIWLAEQLQEDEKLILIGKMPEGQKMPENIISIPVTYDRQELIQYYAMADVFLQPSLEETFGKVTAEAIACGTPVVCFDRTANPELVGENCGAVVTAGDWEAMLQQTRSIMQSGKAAYTPHCVAFAREHFEKNANCKQYETLFKQLQQSQAEPQEHKKRILWLVNMVLPDAAEALGVRTSFSGSWLMDPMKCLSENENVEMATMTYGFVQEKSVVTVNNVRHYVFPGAGKRLLHTSPKTAGELQSVLDDFQPDLIHVYGTEYSIGYSLLKMKPQIPVLVTIQGILTYISKRYKAGLPWYTFYRLITLNQLLKLKMPVLSELLIYKNACRERKILSMASCVSGRTEHDRHFAENINPGVQYYRINYNLREDFYSANKWNKDSFSRYTIFTGAAGYALKGLHILIDALAIVKEKYPEVKLQIPGNQTTYEKSNGYERYIWKKIHKLGLQENVEFIGRRSTQQMIEGLQNAHIYAFPSAYDTDSLSLCEAQFLGVPTVVSRRGGSEFLVEDGKTALCYEFEDTQLLAKHICTLFEDDALCNRLSQAAIAKAERRHDRLKNVQDQLQLYQKLMENAGE